MEHGSEQPLYRTTSIDYMILCCLNSMRCLYLSLPQHSALMSDSGRSISNRPLGPVTFVVVCNATPTTATARLSLTGSFLIGCVVPLSLGRAWWGLTFWHCDLPHERWLQLCLMPELLCVVKGCCAPDRRARKSRNGRWWPGGLGPSPPQGPRVTANPAS